jgi:hypothetical protein
MQLYDLPSVNATYDRFVKPGENVPTKVTFSKWITRGTKYASLAGAGKCHSLFNNYVSLRSFIGSIYLLMLIAEKHCMADFTHMHVSKVSAICDAIRWPKLGNIFTFSVFLYLFNIIIESEVGKNIKNRLIPLVDELRNSIPLTISTLFPKKLLTDIGLPSDIYCHDLRSSDKFFEQFKNK